MFAEDSLRRCPPKVVFSKSLRKFDLEDKVDVSGPELGPGAHQPEKSIEFLSTIPRNRGCFTILSEARLQGFWVQSTFGKAKRGLTAADIKKSSLGPGSYNLSRDISKAVLSHSVSSPSFSMKSRVDSFIPTPKFSIGPADYILPQASVTSTVYNTPSYSIASGKRAVGHDFSGGNPASPGPGAFRAEQAERHIRASSPAFTIKQRLPNPQFKAAPDYTGYLDVTAGGSSVMPDLSEAVEGYESGDSVSPEPKVVGYATAHVQSNQSEVDTTSPATAHAVHWDVTGPERPSTQGLKSRGASSKQLSRARSQGAVSRPRSSPMASAYSSYMEAGRVYGKSFGPQPLSSWKSSPSYSIGTRIPHPPPATPGPAAYGTFRLPHLKDSIRAREERSGASVSPTRSKTSLGMSP